MQRRTIALGLIIGGIVIILGVLLWLFWPKLNVPKPAPPPLPSGITHTTGGGGTAGQPQKAPTVTPGTTNQPASEQQAEDALKQQAMDFTARVATYSSVDGFASIEQVYTEVTPAVQAFFENERTALMAQHPASGPSWGQTTRPIASRFVTPTPILGKSQVELIVQVQQFVTQANQPPSAATYQEADITLQQNNGAWIVSRFQWQPYQP